MPPVLKSWIRELGPQALWLGDQGGHPPRSTPQPLEMAQSPQSSTSIPSSTSSPAHKNVAGAGTSSGSGGPLPDESVFPGRAHGRGGSPRALLLTNPPPRAFAGATSRLGRDGKTSAFRGEVRPGDSPASDSAKADQGSTAGRASSHVQGFCRRSTRCFPCGNS